jgi:hypothetical protein
MPVGYLVYALWYSCLCPLVFLLMPFGYPVYALWLSCLCHLAILFMPFGIPAPKTFFDYISFQTFDFEHLLQVIPETLRM